ncbi:hypothetical protein [Halegenticoccus tardaugens]|uniref:hypothetical protein n=1 Tax=Halegenticoccus tardaugens TaxID=2071624 RepID=UPI00100B5D58|nr:hypothetical protein [Halegenticoccus tardaugens]
MDEARIWGIIGILLAIGGLVVIGPEFVAELQHSGVTEPIVLYGIGVAVAVALTVFIILPSLVSSR